MVYVKRDQEVISYVIYIIYVSITSISILCEYLRLLSVTKVANGFYERIDVGKVWEYRKFKADPSKLAIVFKNEYGICNLWTQIK